jgi:hypothetical protein
LDGSHNWREVTSPTEITQGKNIRMNELNINTYKIDGFKKVCGVEAGDGPYNAWFYKNIDTSLMFSKHSSWVYFVVVDDEIWKVGETGNVLGVPYVRKNCSQPLPGTKGRLGRYRVGNFASGSDRLDTDLEIRNELKPFLEQGAAVEIWAKECPVANVGVTIAGEEVFVGSEIHKELEMYYLDYMFEAAGKLPKLNKLRK